MTAPKISDTCVFDIFEVRAHGKDERVNAAAMFEGEQYLYELVKTLSGG